VLRDFSTKIFVLQMKQDDPKKCTSAKLSRMKLAVPILQARKIPTKAVVLNHNAEIFLPKDREKLKNGIVAIDCSWKYAEKVFCRPFNGLNRRLPILLAGNPINYAKPNKLSSAEAIAAMLYIAGHIEHAQKIISIVKWGPTFLTLNHDPLEEYRLAETSHRIKEIEQEYFSAFL
jgi:pre-rRNA-processing protein TSR3